MLLKLVLWHLVIQLSSSFQIRNEGLSYMESEHDGHGGFFYQNQTGIVSNETRVRLESFDEDVLTFEVEHGQNFSLYCEGNSSEKKFLAWTSNSFEQERINQMTTKPNKNLGKCENTENITDCAVMRIINASGNNVGLYTCQYQSTENSIIPSSESQSIYVYVKDPVQLHAIQKDQIFIFQSVLEIEDFIIGCKPSHPDVKVILNKYRNSEKEPLFDVDRVSFDPKVGFKIHNASNKIDNGLFECYFKYNDHIQKAKWSIDVIQGLNDPPPNPTIGMKIDLPEGPVRCIVGSSEREIKEGKNFTLNCSVASSNPHKLKIEWHHNGTLLNTNTVALRERFPIVFQNELKIVSASSATSGTYSCIVKNQGGISSSSNVSIKVFDDSNSKCALRAIQHQTVSNCTTDVQGCVPVCTSAKQLANFTMRSGDHKVLWHLPSGVKMSSDDYLYSQTLSHHPGKFRFSFMGCQQNGFFQISQTSLWDQGIYTFYCNGEKNALTADDDKNKVKFCLKVTDTPTTTVKVVNHNYHRFVVNSSYTFECSITSNPLPDKVKWRICNLSEDDCNYKTYNFIKEEKQQLSILHMKPGGREFETQSILEWRAGEETRSILCMACLKDNCYPSSTLTIETLDYYPPLAEVFGVCKEVTLTGFCVKIEQPNSEDDDATVMSITKYETEVMEPIVYAHSKRGFRKEKFEAEMKEFALAKTGKRKEFSTSRHSYQVHWSSKNLTLADSGNFSIGDKTIILKVLNINSPILLPENNMNGSTIYTQIDSSQVVLNCSAAGIPTPQYSWYKDGKPLNTSIIERLWNPSVNSSTIKFFTLEESDAGTYSCVAKNLAGNITLYKEVSFKAPGPYLSCNDKLVCSLLVTVLVAIGMFTVLLFVLFYLYRRQKLAREHEVAVFLHGNPALINDNLPLDEQVTLLPYNPEMEFPRNRLKLGTQIGSGAFGRVFKAEAIGIANTDVLTVAVKMANSPVDSDHLSALMAEIKIMLYIGKHLNIVNLLGACTGNLKSKHELLAIVEYCCFGNIQQFLIKNRNNFVNQVDPKTGLFVETIPSRRESSQRTSFNASIYRPSSVRYVKLSLSVEGGSSDDITGSLLDATVIEEGEQEEYLSLNNQADNNERTHKVSIISSDSQFDNVVNNTDMTEMYNNGVTRPRAATKRNHKISIMSTDSQFDNFVNATDMTELSNQDFEMEERKTFSTKDLLSWGYQIAKGMEYLASKRVIHGDLAARNVLLAEDNVVKICDFGLAKNMYTQSFYKKKSGVPMPIKWMALEALNDNIFSTQTDVWSYGIVLWEIFSLGRTPYPAEPIESFQAKIASGLRLSKPYYSPDDLYRVMSDCWLTDPKMRPSFSELADKLGETLMEGDREHYFQLSKPYEVENEELQKKYVLLRGISETQETEFANPTEEDKATTSHQEQSTELSPLRPESHGSKVEASKFQTSFYNPSYETRCNGDILSSLEVPVKIQASIDVPDRVETNLKTDPIQEQSVTEEQSSANDTSTICNFERPNSSASSRSSGFHSAFEEGSQPGGKLHNHLDIFKTPLNKTYRKRALQSSVELRLACLNNDLGGFSATHATPPPSYDSAVRDRRRFSFTNVYVNSQN